MANKNNKKWFVYIILVVIALFIIKPLSDDEILPVQVTAQNHIKSNTSKHEPKKITFQPSQKDEKQANPVGYVPYKVKPHYPTQDVFDENICSIDKLHMDYKPLLKNAINSLNDRYQHYHYNISAHLELNIYATKMTTYFEKELIERISTLHQEYINLLGESAEREINLNLVITPERSDYDYYVSLYSANLIESLGVYFGGVNIAFVDYQGSDDKALKTAIHETVHALNAHIIGKTPRMFNEGMAEFYENMIVKEGNIEIIFTRKQLTKEPYPLMQFFDYQQWSSLDIHHLYYSSWAWIAFMFGDNNRIHSLISFMEKEQIDPCTSFSAGESYEILQEKDSMFEPDFYLWQQNMNTN
jgi:hypothetical protein